MTITFINKKSLDANDLGIIHGLLCQNQQGFRIQASSNDTVRASLKIEWGVPVMVISKETTERNFWGTLVVKECRISLDDLTNKIKICSESIWKNADEYARLLGIDIQIRLRELNWEADILVNQSRISKVFNYIRYFFFPSARKDHIFAMRKFCVYTGSQFIATFYKNFIAVNIFSSQHYTHAASFNFFVIGDIDTLENSDREVDVRVEAIDAQAKANRQVGVLTNSSLDPL